jgi:uncharacterized protein YggE
MRHFFLAAALIIAAGPAAALAEAPHPLITITGQGSALAPPDIATVNAGVETIEDTAAEALAENSDVMADVIETLTRAGIEPRDIQTSGLTVQPQYTSSRSSGSYSGQELSGYRVYNSVTTTVRDLDGLGDVLDRLVKSGANRIGGVRFGFADPAEMVAEARKGAVEDAKLTAQTYADAAGIKLGQILSISDFGGSGGGVRVEMDVAQARSSVPIAQGQSAITATVQIVWEIAP